MVGSLGKDRDIRRFWREAPLDIMFDIHKRLPFCSGRWRI